MRIYQEIDKWMYDIEQELKGNYVNRSSLQRKHMKLKAIRDRLYNMAVKNCSERFPPIKHCLDRVKPPGPPGFPKPPAVPTTRRE